MNIYFLYRNTIFIIILILLTKSLSAEPYRYNTQVFDSIKVTLNVEYGLNFSIDNNLIKLYADIYEPAADTFTSRPLVIWIHGGCLTSGSRTNFAFHCTDLAQRGYVSASISYRLGIEEPYGVKTVEEALLRAIQDVKAAVRFFKRKAEKYRVDTTKIYLAGSSAGGMIALNYAYWDQDEICDYVDQYRWGDLEGTSGNPGYSSSVQGIISHMGAIIDTSWMEKGDIPVAVFHGLKDTLLYPDVGISPVFGINLFGGVAVARTADHLGIINRTAFLDNVAHTAGTDSTTIDSLLKFTAGFVYSLVSTVTSVSTDDEQFSEEHYLLQNYPNPFNPSTKIKFYVPLTSNVRIEVYTLHGSHIRTLINGVFTPGAYLTEFNGAELATGIYIIQCVFGSHIEVKKIMLLK